MHELLVTHPVKVITGVRVPMRDGVELNVRLTMPDAPGPFPGVMEYNPYRRLGTALPDYRDEYPPVVPYLAERGYAVVQFDVRGTGSSSGFSTDIYSAEERRDGFDMVAWIASQPWCSGAVGMIGKSYGAVVQWQVAVQRPPALKAIVVRSANDDVYTEFSNPGGSIRPWMFEAYAPQMNALNFAPPDPDLVGARWQSIWSERLEKSQPWSLGYLRNLVHGPYWRSRSLAPGYDRVECAVLLIEGWADWYATAELRAYQRLSVPRKVLIGPWGHYYPEEKDAFPGPRIDSRPIYLRWFDRWLKGVDNGVMDEPPVTVFVRGWQQPSLFCREDAGSWRAARTWPPEGTRDRKLFLAPGGRLADSPQSAPTRHDFRYRPSVGLSTGRRGLGATTPFAMPLDQRLDDLGSLLYQSEPMPSRLTLMGEPEAVLYVSSTAPTAYFHVKLCDIAADGTSRLITDGGLSATHRTSHEQPSPLSPGDVYELRFPLKHCAYSIDAGHRLSVAISGADFQNAWPTGIAATHTIHAGGVHGSSVTLPVAPDQSTEAAPRFEPSPHPTPTEAQLARPSYSFELDPLSDTVTCRLASPERGTTVNRSRYTVSDREPQRATIEGTAIHRPAHSTLEIEVEARCLTSSDADTYRHTSDVRITIGGELYWQKSWSETVPRNGS